MTCFIHLTDLHLSHPDSRDPDLHSDTMATLAQVVGMIAAMDPAPDFVVASGDLTNHGDEASYRLLREMLAPLEMPVLLALGNHDSRAGYRAVFAGTKTDTPTDAPLMHDSVQGALHVVVLDTGVPGHVGGALDAEAAGFLDAALKRHPERPKLLILHHPPRVGEDDLPWTSLDAASTDRLAALIAGHPVAGILSGHVHINRVSMWRGVPIIIGTGLHSTIDLLERRDLRVREGSGFGIGTWRPSGLSMAFVPVSPAAREITVIDRARLLAFR